jgi:DNA-binding NtrC family response regulator
MSRGIVLIADDDTSVRNALNEALVHAGYAPRATGSAATLWRWVSHGKGDVVLTDVVMPDDNAFDLIPRIKKIRPDLPIIVMSTLNTLMTAPLAAEIGAYEYLTKPFDLDETVAVIGRALSQSLSRPLLASQECAEAPPDETNDLRGPDAKDLSKQVERYLAEYFAGFGKDLPPPGLYERVIRQVELPLVTAALAATRGNQFRAAVLLGLNRNTLRSLIRALEIKVTRTTSQL